MGKAYEPWSPPLVEMATGGIGHLLEWRLHERNGEWWAWVSWVQTAGDRPKHMVLKSGRSACARSKHPSVRRCPAAHARQGWPDTAVGTRAAGPQGFRFAAGVELALPPDHAGSERGGRRGVPCANWPWPLGHGEREGQ